MVGILMAVWNVSYIVKCTWFAQAFVIAPYQTDVVVLGGITLLIYPPLVLLFQKYLKPIMRLQSTGAWKYITAIPFTFAILSIVTTAQLCKQEMSVVNLVLSMSIIGGSFFVCICLSKGFRQMEAATIIQERSKQTTRLLALQKTQYNTLAKNIEQTRETMHDIRYQLAAISMMTQQKEYDKLLTFVADYCKSLPDNRMVLCENYAANSIIAHYVELAKGEGIVDIDIKCVLGYDSRIEDIDLCALLGNLLENAIEGCKTVPLEKRKIKLRITPMQGDLCLR